MQSSKILTSKNLSMYIARLPPPLKPACNYSNKALQFIQILAIYKINISIAEKDDKINPLSLSITEKDNKVKL